MSSDTILKICHLSCGTPVTVTDATRHYFGGYFHVRIHICADISVCSADFEDACEGDDALSRLGRSVSFCRTLEKMAVPEGELDNVRQHLMNAFDTNVLPYLQREGFSSNFVRSEYRKKLKIVSPVYR